MFIEAAFLRFNEAIIKSGAGKCYWNEQQIRGIFARSIIDELTSRLVSYPSLMVNFERRYNLSGELKKSLVADIHADFDRNSFDHAFRSYGFSSENWVEIKYFSGWQATRSRPSTTTNTASILKDILRLVILTGGKAFNQNRYLLLVFDNRPDKYLAKDTKGSGERQWLNLLLDETYAHKELQIDLRSEGPHFLKESGAGGIISDLDLSVFSQTFAPRPNSLELIDFEDLSKSGLLFYSYLVRIDRFVIRWGGKTLPSSKDQETYNLCRELAAALWG